MSRRGGSTPDTEVATLRRYLKEIARYRPLTHDDEIDLAKRIHSGDEDAVRELVESNLRFVVAYAKRFRNPQVMGIVPCAPRRRPSPCAVPVC